MLPKTGRRLHQASESEAYPKLIAASLRAELGTTHAAAKILMRWTGASERTVKNWLSGASGPSGEHLLELLRYSDAVLGAILRASGRDGAVFASGLAELHLSLIAAASAIEAIIRPADRDDSSSSR